MEITKEQLERIRKEFEWQSTKPCKEGEYAFHEALGFECGMRFVCDVLNIKIEGMNHITRIKIAEDLKEFARRERR